MTTSIEGRLRLIGFNDLLWCSIQMLHSDVLLLYSTVLLYSSDRLQCSTLVFYSDVLFRCSYRGAPLSCSTLVLYSSALLQCSTLMIYWNDAESGERVSTKLSLNSHSEFHGESSQKILQPTSLHLTVENSLRRWSTFYHCLRLRDAGTILNWNSSS